MTPRNPAAGPPAATAADRPRGRGPRLPLFAVLGGPVAWALHLLVAWSVVELACASGRGTLLGAPLGAVVWAATLVPAAVAGAALAVAWRAVRVLPRPHDPGDGPEPRAGSRPAVPDRLRRAGFTADVALWLDALSLAMIVLGGAAVAVLPTCGG